MPQIISASIVIFIPRVFKNSLHMIIVLYAKLPVRLKFVLPNNVQIMSLSERQPNIVTV